MYEEKEIGDVIKDINGVEWAVQEKIRDRTDDSVDYIVTNKQTGETVGAHIKKGFEFLF